MQLSAIATGQTRTIEMRSSPIQTAFLKTPVSGPCYVHEHGLAGNETAVHPDAIYAIANEHYEFWANRLGADRSAWLPGQFAENLTIAGLDESSLRVGDVIAIGPDVTLIITGPRIPCFKLAWRFSQPDSFVREFGLSGRSGVYFGVLRTGWIEAGMPVEIVKREPDHPTVAEIARLVLDCPQPPEQPIRALLALPYLSRSAALVLSSLLMRVIDQGPQSARWNDWREFTVTATADECEDVKSFALAPSDGRPLPRARAGQFVTVQVPLASGDPVIRPWSISDYSENPVEFRITVKRQTTGAGSSELHANVRAGARLLLRPPSGRFVLDRGGFMPVVLIGAGIGITPLLAMAKAHLARGDGTPPLLLFHCVRNSRAHPMRRQIDALAAAYPQQLQVHYVYSQPTDEDTAQSTYHRAGRLSVEDVIANLDGVAITLGSKRVAIPWFESDFYICGPESFEATLVTALVERGARPGRVFVEHFHSRGEITDAGSLDTAEVVFAHSGTTATWSGQDGLTLLQLAERSGLSPPNGCRMGICSSCQCAILEGDVRYDSRPIGEITAQSALLCCAKPATQRVVLAL
jgi:ferredoxin-NADP reductase/MOSC domain-containing protein YiiM